MSLPNTTYCNIIRSFDNLQGDLNICLTDFFRFVFDLKTHLTGTSCSGNIISMVIFLLCSLFSALINVDCVLCRSLPHEVYNQQCRVHKLGVLKNSSCSKYINTVIIFDIAVPV